MRPILRSWIYAACAATLAGAVCLTLAWSAASQRMGVIIANPCVLRSGPLDEAPAALTVHDGAELKILDQKDDWYQVTLGDRRIGWIRKNQAQVL